MIEIYYKDLKTLEGLKANFFSYPPPPPFFFHFEARLWNFQGILNKLDLKPPPTL